MIKVKEVILFSFLLLIGTSVCCQLPNANWMIGGNGYFSFGKDEQTRRHSLSIDVEAARKIVKGLYGGIRIGHSSFAQKERSSGSCLSCFLHDSKNYRFGISSRYYPKQGKLIAPFLSFALLRSFEKYSSRGRFINPYQKNKQLLITPGVGLSLFLSDKVALDTKLEYQWSKQNLRSETNESSSDSNKSLFLRFGFQLFL